MSLDCIVKITHSVSYLNNTIICQKSFTNRNSRFIKLCVFVSQAKRKITMTLDALAYIILYSIIPLTNFKMSDF